jgi:propionyl-CoA carboxylase alpha chain
VTECITGVDLVELMIRVAAGEKLPLTQADMKRNGWAIECRINAEDPFDDFRPSPGRIEMYYSPGGRGVRVDSHAYAGYIVPPHYDSLVSKLITYGKDRNEAIAKMREALNGFVIRGISSNIPFQAALLAHPKFVTGDFNTGFIAEHYAKGFYPEDVPHDDPDFLVALAAYVNRRALQRAAGISGQMPGHEFTVGEDFVAVLLDAAGNHKRQGAKVSDFQAVSGSSVVDTGGKRYEICSPKWHLGGNRMRGPVSGAPYPAQVERGVGKNPMAIRIIHNGTRLDTLVLTPRAAELHALMPYKAPPDMSRFVLSPMPGLLVEVAVEPGQKVQAGERVAVIEAMKMENVLFAATDGVVANVLASKGESLVVDQPIVEFA